MHAQHFIKLRLTTTKSQNLQAWRCYYTQSFVFSLFVQHYSDCGKKLTLQIQL